MAAHKTSTFGKINEDLLRERTKCSFKISDVTHILDGGQENTVKRKQIGKLNGVLVHVGYQHFFFTCCLLVEK